MATPQYNIKTGSDSSTYFSREITESDKDSDGKSLSAEANEIGRIKSKDGSNGTDLYEYPVLVRRTGDSLKGTTESIESNELRKGRTKSAPRKGNSSSEGSLDFELSPETYDDILEGALRNDFKDWKTDSYDSKTKTRGSDTNLDNEITSIPYGFFTKLGNVAEVNKDGSKGADVEIGERKAKGKRLFATKAAAAAIRAADGWGDDYLKDPNYPLIVVPNGKEYEVAELTCGKKDIRYSVLKHFGGIEGEDLYQEFQHNSVNTVSLEVTPGQIVTGSFGFMGANNPEILDRGHGFVDSYAKTTDTKIDSAKIYYVLEDGEYKEADTPNEADIGTYYEKTTSEPSGLVKYLSDYTSDKDGVHEGRLDNGVTGDGKVAADNTEAVEQWLKDLPEKGTSTDQYTAREGFLYINGERVRYGSNLSLELNNGLEKTFAIFEKDAIATSPLSLDITGSLGAYLIKGYTEKLASLATNDKDAEILFCFQDKEDDPTALYAIQIFKTKLTDLDLSSGAENLEATFPWQSFEERAMRIFRIRTVRTKTVEITDSKAVKAVLSTAPVEFDENGATAALTADEIAAKGFTVTVNGEDHTPTEISVADDLKTATLTIDELPDEATVKVTYNGVQSKGYNWEKPTSDEPVTPAFTSGTVTVSSVEGLDSITSAESDDLDVVSASAEDGAVKIVSAGEGTANVTVKGLKDSADAEKILAVTVSGSGNSGITYSVKTDTPSFTAGSKTVESVDGLTQIVSAVSGDESIVKASVDGGKLTLTSVKEGAAEVTVNGNDSETATLEVTVSGSGDDGITYSVKAKTATFTASTKTISNTDVSLETITSATPADTSVATAEVSGNTVTITSVKEGKTDIVLAGTDTGGDAEKTLEVTVSETGEISYTVKTAAVTFTASTKTVSTVDGLDTITGATSDTDSIVTAAFSDGVVTLTSVAEGTANVTVNGTTGSETASKTLAVTVAADGTIDYTVS